MTDAPRTVFSFTSLLALAACGGPPVSGGEPLVTPAADACLPVVSAECGCSYPCSAGTRVAGSEPPAYHVHSEFWSTPLPATVSEWCVGDACTPAFHVELVCDGICERRPADATCGFREGRCSSGREGADRGAQRP